MNRREAREALGLPPVYTLEEVEEAYRERARAAHPDKGGTNEQFRAITEGRRILMSAPPRQGRLVIKDDRPLHRLAGWLRHPRKPKHPRVT